MTTRRQPALIDHPWWCSLTHYCGSWAGVEAAVLEIAGELPVFRDRIHVLPLPTPHVHADVHGPDSLWVSVLRTGDCGSDEPHYLTTRETQR